MDYAASLYGPKPVVVSLSGKPGAGKGTIIRGLFDELDYNGMHGRLQDYHMLGIGKLIGQKSKSDSAFGVMSKKYQASSQLLPSDIINGLVDEWIVRNDWKGKITLLDGYPRDRAQAEHMTKVCDAQAIINLDITDEDVIKRISNDREECKDCKTPYSMIKKELMPKVAKVCDKCGGEVGKWRVDDTPEAVLERLNTYKRETEPVFLYYQGMQNSNGKQLLRNIKVVDDEKQNLKAVLDMLFEYHLAVIQ